MKKLILTLIIITALIGYYAYATSQGANSPGTMADSDAVGTVAWTNPDNAKVSDDVYVTVVLTNPETSHYLKATNFGFAIPTGATINGVLVETESKSSSASANAWDVIKLVKGGVVGGTNHRPLIGGLTESYISTGSSSDLWGLSFTPADINATDFGVVYSEQPPGVNPYTISIDHIRITVYYTDATPQVQVRSGNIKIMSGNLKI